MIGEEGISVVGWDAEGLNRSRWSNSFLIFCGEVDWLLSLVRCRVQMAADKSQRYPLLQ